MANNSSNDAYLNDWRSLDFSDFAYPADKKSVPTWEIVLKSVVYFLIVLFSVVGNILIVVVVMKNEAMKTVTNYYIVNMAVADLLVTIGCIWVFVVDDLTEGWVLGAFFCKFNSFTQVLCLVASVLSLALIAYDRFFGIVCAVRAHVRERKASLSIFLIWIFSFAVSLPILIYRKVHTRLWSDFTEIWCADDWPVKEEQIGGATVASLPLRSAYYVSVTVVLYFIPMTIMAVAYGLIIIKLEASHIPGEVLHRQDEQQAKTKRKIIIMLIAILMLFCVCWLPFTILVLYSELREVAELPKWFSGFNFAAYTMAYSNSALNPLVYAGFNENFKKGLHKLWGGILRKRGHHDSQTTQTSRLNTTEL